MNNFQRKINPIRDKIFRKNSSKHQFKLTKSTSKINNLIREINSETWLEIKDERFDG